MKNIKKILIFKLCCLGDIVFLTPTIINLKKNFPDAKIYLIASGWIRALKEFLPEIDEVLNYEPPFEVNIFKKIISSIKLTKLLRKEKFDLVFLGHRTNYFGLILFLSGIRYRFGFKETKFTNRNAPFDISKPEVLRYLDILESNNIKIFTRETYLKRVRNKETIKKDLSLPPEKRVIGIFPFGGVNPGTQMRIKRWGIDRYEKLLKMLEEYYQGDVINLIFEGKLEDEKYKVSNEFKYTYAFGTDIEGISACDVFISGDTGLLHIAAAFGVSTIALFGPSNPAQLAPLQTEGVPHITIWKHPSCSPCYTPMTAIDKSNKKYWNGNTFICNTGTLECMKDISEEEVFHHIKNIIVK